MDLRQGTAAVIVFGPALSPSDGVTPIGTLASAMDSLSTGIKLAKNGNAGVLRNGTPTATIYDNEGDYRVALNTVDTNTLGRLRVRWSAPGSTIAIWTDYMVLTAAAYDAKYT